MIEIEIIELKKSNENYTKNPYCRNQMMIKSSSESQLETISHKNHKNL